MNHKIISGFKCYAPEMLESPGIYPDAGYLILEDSATLNFWDKSRLRLIKNQIRKIIPIIKGFPELIDIGCGSGILLANLKESFGSKINLSGSEINLNGLIATQKRVGPIIDLFQLDITNSPLIEKYDIVTICDVIEHLDDDSAALKGCYSSLKNGGHLIITVPQYQFLWGPIDDYVCHKRRYTKANLIDLLKSQGFIINYSTSFIFALFPLLAISKIITKIKSSVFGNNFSLDEAVKFNPASNYLCSFFMHFDEFFIQRGISLPFGGSLFILAQKPS